MGKNVLQAVDAWRQAGFDLADSIEAERDTVRHRIDQDHAYMVTLNERLREVRALLGVSDGDAATPQRARIIPMSRAEQREVPVERVAKSASAAHDDKTRAARAFLATGPKTTAEVAAYVGMPKAHMSALLGSLRGRGEVKSEPIGIGTRALRWSLTTKGAA